MSYTKKLFGTDGVRGKAYEYPIIAEVATQLGEAAVAVLLKKTSPSPIVIGTDTRKSCGMLEDALIDGITSMGADVFRAGCVPTPAVSFLVRSLGACAGIMISASHNPYTDNGIKFFDLEGKKLTEKVEEEIERYVQDVASRKESKNVHVRGVVHEMKDAHKKYSDFARATMNNVSLSETKIVLDCANGAASHVAPQIFRSLGAEVIVLNDHPNGININKACGALFPEGVADQVRSHSAAVGISLDGDADRVVMVDEGGAVLDGDQILAIAALSMMSKKKLHNNTVVATDYSNRALDELMHQHGGYVVRTENGDRHVSQKMIEGEYNLGGENSGHIIFSDFNPTGDGIVAGLQILKIMKETGNKLSELAMVLTKYPQVVVSVDVDQKKPFVEMPEVVAEINRVAHILGKKGRHIIRYSGTEMKARVMVEGERIEDITRLAQAIAQAIVVGNKKKS